MNKILRNLLFFAVLSTASSIYSQTKIKQMITVFETRKELSGVKQINVEGKFCKVNIVPSDADYSLIEGKLEAMVEHESYNIVIDEVGGVANVSIVVPAEAFSSFAGEMTISVAKGVAVDVNNTSGYVDLNDVKGSDIKVNTTQGRIKAAGCQGNVSLNTKNGKITATKMSGSLTTVSSKGDQELTDIDGECDFESQDGSLMVTNVKGNVKSVTVAGLQTYSNFEGNLKLKGSSGAVRISNATGVFNVVTTNASVNLYEVKAEMHIETTRGAIVGQKGITLTASSDFTTTEGKVQMRLMNAKDDLTFQLTAENSNASLIAKGTSKKKKLNMGKGSIVVTGKTRTGSQVYS